MVKASCLGLCELYACETSNNPRWETAQVRILQLSTFCLSYSMIMKSIPFLAPLR